MYDLINNAKRSSLSYKHVLNTYIFTQKISIKKRKVNPIMYLLSVKMELEQKAKAHIIK